MAIAEFLRVIRPVFGALGAELVPCSGEVVCHPGTGRLAPRQKEEIAPPGLA
jgi:hypothetical protein